ncbi:MAG: hypothetical protein NTX82_03920 [Candidatus Parcubacteria bacterium]|nr:hypothetical protein [Candidatus Parcubacteria bacterium]
MPEKKKELTVETFHCKCGQSIRFFDLSEHDPLSDNEKKMIGAQKAMLVQKGQKIKCPNPKCDKEITIC